MGPSIIGFGSYRYKYESEREGDMLVIAFSPRKAATVLYGVTGSAEAKALLRRLGKHSLARVASTSKSSRMWTMKSCRP